MSSGGNVKLVEILGKTINLPGGELSLLLRPLPGVWATPTAANDDEVGSNEQ